MPIKLQYKVVWFFATCLFYLMQNSISKKNYEYVRSFWLTEIFEEFYDLAHKNEDENE